MLIIKSEGVQVTTATLVKRLSEVVGDDGVGVEVRETILGHVVRGGAPTVTDRVIAQRLGFAALTAVLEGAHDTMCAWDAPRGMGTPTNDHSVTRIALADVITETAALLDGTSPVTKGRLALLARVEGLLAL